MSCRGFRLITLGVVAAALLGGSATASMPAGNVLVQGGPIQMSHGLRVGPDGLLYVASIGSGIVVIHPDTGEIVRRMGLEVGVVTPEDVTFGPDGSLYWSSMFTGEVGRFTPAGAREVQMVAPMVNPLTFSADGRLFTTDAWISDTLWELDPQLVAPPRVLAQGLGGLKGTDWGADGFLYGALWKKGEVVRVDVSASPVTVATIAGGFGAPFTAKLNSAGKVFVVDRPFCSVFQVDPTTGSRERQIQTPCGVDSVAFGPGDRMFLSSYSDGAVFEVLGDGTIRTVSPGGMALPAGVAVLPRADGESIFVADVFSLREYDAVTGAERSTVRSTFNPASVLGAWTVSTDGQVLVVSEAFLGSVAVWDPQTQQLLEQHMEFVNPINAVRFRGDLIVNELGTAPGEARVLRVGAGGTSVMADAAANIFLPAGLAMTADALWVSDAATGRGGLQGRDPRGGLGPRVHLRVGADRLNCRAPQGAGRRCPPAALRRDHFQAGISDDRRGRSGHRDGARSAGGCTAASTRSPACRGVARRRGGRGCHRRGAGDPASRPRRRGRGARPRAGAGDTL